MSDHARWKSEEVSALRRCWDYSWQGVIAAAQETGRSNFAVWSKAFSLGYKLQHQVTEWTEDEVAALTYFWNVEQKTANEIAGIMGRSRNSIIGKARRVKLDSRPTPIKVDVAKVKRERRDRDLPRVKRNVKTEGGQVHLFDLKNGQCRFPMWGDDERPSHVYCGHSTEGHRNYCPGHRAVVVREKISAEDLAKVDDARRNSHKRQKFVFG